MKTLKTTALLATMGSLVFGASVAVAAPGDGAAQPQCEGKHGQGKGKFSKEERFKKHDKNGDGFWTSAEVGEKRWERLKAADANKDGKISLSELQQAWKDGKLKGKHGKRGKGNGNDA